MLLQSWDTRDRRVWKLMATLYIVAYHKREILISNKVEGEVRTDIVGCPLASMYTHTKEVGRGRRVRERLLSQEADGLSYL